MTRQSWIPYLILGLTTAGLAGCRSWPLCGPAVAPPDPPAVDHPTPVVPSAYHAEQPPSRPDVQPAHFAEAPPVKIDAPPPVTPPAQETPVVQADKAPPEPPPVAALRDLLQNRAPEALEQLRNYDAASRELLLILLPLAARVGDGGLDHATPQETALLLEQVRQVEAVLRPRAALALDKVCLCRKINGFGDCEPWPADHVFQAGADERYGERMQVYVEVRNFTCRPCGQLYETSLSGVLEIKDFTNHTVSRIDFPASEERGQTPRQDYFINFQFHLPRLPEGRYTLHVQVKDVLAPPAGDAAPRRASRSLDFSVGGAGRE